MVTCYGTWNGSACDGLAYGALNRLTKKTYSDSTPPANFYYDQSSVTIGSWSSGTLGNPKGRLTEATTTQSGSVKTAVIYSYDGVGRVVNFWQCNPNNCGGSSIYNTNYTYDWAGDVSQWSHPGLINLVNTVNAAQQVTQVQTTSQYTNLPQTLAQNITYTPWGAVSSLQNGCTPSGSCTNAQETYQYNKRLQPWVISLAAASGAGYCLVYNYYSSWTPPTTCPSAGSTPPTGNATDNGNVMGYWYNDSVQSGFSHTASYSYDNVNRLTGATATGNSTYNQIYSYTLSDGSNGQYGNMTCTTGCTPANWTLNPGNNQLIPTSSYTYDAAGNLTKDSSISVHTYQWDAEGRVSVVDPGSNPTWTFTYNAVGDRVQWAYAGGTYQHIFDPKGGWLGIYGVLDVLRWGDRALLWYTGTETYFNHVNNIGSTSMMTNHAGTAVEDVLFYPWGQTWPSHVWGGGGYNFATMPYYDPNANTNPTMYRFYTQNLGRWHSPDPLAGDITNPQSLNRYAYVMNNPTTLVDPLGLDDQLICGPVVWNPNGGSNGQGGWEQNCVAPPEAGWEPSPGSLFPPEEQSQSNHIPSGGGAGVPITRIGRQHQPLPTRPDTRPPCIETFGNSVFGEGSTPPNDEALSKTAEAASTATAAKAWEWAADRALSYPLKSSVVRTWLAASEALGAFAEAVPLAFAIYDVGKASLKTAVANAKGECRPGLSYITHP